MFPWELKLIIGALIAGILFQWLMGFFLKKWYKQINLKALHFDLNPAMAPLRLLIPALSVSFILPLLHFSEPAQSILQHFVQLWIMACLGWLLTRSVHIFRDAMMNKYQVTKSDFHVRRIYTQVRIIEHILDLLIWVLTLALMIMTFSQIKEIGMSIFASAGLMSVVIGFAAQKTLGNVIAGIQIAMSQPIRLEDEVIVENEYGSVEEITLTYVVVRIWDLRRIILPISYFIEKPFQNWTRTSTDMLGTVLFYVDYTVPIDKLREELTKILTASVLWDKKVNVLQVSNIKESSIEISALMSASNSGALGDLRCEVREKLLTFIRSNYPESLSHTRMELLRKSPV